MIYFDTESIGFTGPTVLIQWADGRDGEVHLHDIFQRPVSESLELIERLAGSGVCGYNLSHDWFHVSRTYGTLSCLPKRRPPTIMDIADVEDSEEAHDRYCVKPVRAIDLMLWGRKGEFQSTMGRKDIVIRKVPRALSDSLIEALHERVRIPSIYFSKNRKGYHWEVKEIDRETGREGIGITPDPDFVNVKLKFSPSTALKAVIENMFPEFAVQLGIDSIGEMGEGIFKVKNPMEYGYYPSSGAWLPVAHEHIYAWTNDPRRRKYAVNDVLFTRKVAEYFKYPGEEGVPDTDSMLACAVGAMHWKGFAVDLVKVTQRIKELEALTAGLPINVNSPQQVRGHLFSLASPVERLLVQDTSKKTLLEVMGWKDENKPLADAAAWVYQKRRDFKELDLLQKLRHAKRLYATFKVVGTKSNRMGGGSEVGRGGSINPQGIKKGPGIRSMFPLAGKDMILCGGDFSSFEVCIADAQWGDHNLHQDLLEGKKIHGLFGMSFYGLSYDEIMATEEISGNDDNGYYSRSKNAVFAFLYGAEEKKLAETLRIPVSQLNAAIRLIEDRYPGIRKARERIFESHAPLVQGERAIGWIEPKEYCESFLGFRRYFTMEYEVMRGLYSLIENPTDKLKEVGKGIDVVRRGKSQTGLGATASALFGAMFGLQGQIVRAAANHTIQSPGGQITKEVQGKVWELQPCGVSSWVVMPMNIHDELQVPCVTDSVDRLKATVDQAVSHFKPVVPLIKMKFKTGLSDWSKK